MNSSGINSLILKQDTETTVNNVKDVLEKWIKSEALSSLAEAFGGKPPLEEGYATLAKWYLDFSDCWDFRSHQRLAFDGKVGEGARWLVSNDDLSESQKSFALEAASQLGLMDNSVAPHNAYDYILVLGGAKLSCLLRSRLALKSIEASTDKPVAVIMLASTRPIGDAEREATDTYAPNAATEFDLFVATAESEFGVTNFREERFDDPENANKSWAVRTYPTEGYEIKVIAAPSSEPEKRRANSADTYVFFLERFAVPNNSRLLLCTSQIYVPYQHLEAVRTIAIPHSINLDTVGFPVEWGGTLQGMNEPSNYLQEIRSTIQSIGRLNVHISDLQGVDKQNDQ
jgi:hypothetical protein